MISEKTEHCLKIITLEDAAALIESEDSIWVGSALSVPSPLLDELANRYEVLHNVTLLGHNFINYSEMLIDPKYCNAFHVISFFESSPFSSLSFETNNLEYIKKPCGPYQKTIWDKYNIDVMIVEICPPDKNGNCNLGVTGRSITPYLCKCNGIKIAVINELQHPALDDEEQSSIPLSDFDYCCICKHPVLKKSAD